MKNNQIALVLAGLMFMMTLWTAWLLWGYRSTAKELQDLTVKIQLANNTQSFMQQLLAQVVEYSKTHPAINPLLQGVTNAGTNTPADATIKVKPAAK